MFNFYSYDLIGWFSGVVRASYDDHAKPVSRTWLCLFNGIVDSVNDIGRENFYTIVAMYPMPLSRFEDGEYG